MKPKFSNDFAITTVAENSVCEDQINEKYFEEKIRKAVDNAVMTVENRTHDAILTALDNVVIPRFETAMRSITESSRRGRSSVVQNPDPWDFTRSILNRIKR